MSRWLDPETCLRRHLMEMITHELRRSHEEANGLTSPHFGRQKGAAWQRLSFGRLGNQLLNASSVMASSSKVVLATSKLAKATVRPRG